MEILYSITGSKGNCSVIESGDKHLLVIDAGIKYRTVDKSIGYRLHKADVILITHVHDDHTHYLDDFIFNRTKVFISHNTLSGCNIYASKDSYFFIDESNTLETDGFKVSAFELVHTHANGTPCECYGFLILDKSTGEKMLWATDTQFIKNRFPPLEYYCIESNYFESDDYNEDIDYIQKKVEQRRLQSHMSFESAVKFLKMQDLSKCKEIRLLHLSSFFNEKDKLKMRRKLKSELKNEINWKEVNLIV